MKHHFRPACPWRNMNAAMRPRWLLAALVVICSFVWSGQATAQLLYSGGEDIDFLCSSPTACAVATAAGAFRSNWAREAYTVGGSASDPPTSWFETPTLSANSTLWIHGQYCTIDAGLNCNYANNNTTSNAQMLRILDSSGNPAIVVRGTGTAGQLKISSRTTAGAFTDLVTCPNAFNSNLTQLDLYINYGTSGQATLYSNGSQVCNFTGNVTNGDGATTLDQAQFVSPVVYDNYEGAWSEVIIATTDTRAMARFTANTAGNGNTTGFSGTNVCSAIWSVTTANDANYGYSGTSNVIHECTVNSAIPPGSYTVLGLVMSARALVGASGPMHFDFVTRTGGTDYTSSDYAPTTSFSNFVNYVQTVNPATSNPWAVSDFQTTGFNVGEETKP